MDNKEKLKTFMENDTSIIAQVDAHIGTNIELASWLGLSAHNKQNCEERCYAHVNPSPN
jgi:hypothetical protein